MGSAPFRVYKYTNAVHSDSPGVYTSVKIFNSTTIDKIHFKTDVIDGRIVKGFRQPILYSLLLDEPAGCEDFSQPELIHYRKINKTVLNTITFYLEEDDHEEVNSTGETLSFTLQVIKIWTFECAFKNLKLILTVLVVDINQLQ